MSEAAVEKIITAPCTSVLHAWVNAEVTARIAEEAERRRMHPDRLAAAILTVAAQRGLLDFILES